MVACIKVNIKKLVAGILYYTRALNVIRAFVNRFELERNTDGMFCFPFIKKKRYDAIQILVYHRVNDDADSIFPATPIEVFRKQMRYLASAYNVIPLGEAVDRIERDDIPENAVVITFDDGYGDNYFNAFPILQKLKLPATMFLATGAIGTGKILWHDQVFHGFRRTQSPVLEKFGAFAQDYPMKTQNEKLTTLSRVLDFLWSLDERAREKCIDQLLAKLNVPDADPKANVMLTWEQVMTMYRGNITFGSHTVTHPILSRLSFDRAKAEIEESKRLIERRLNFRVTAFAYPIGRQADFDENIKGLLRNAGYRCAVTTVVGSNGAQQDLFELRRGTPWDEDIPGFALRMCRFKFAS